MPPMYRRHPTKWRRASTPSNAFLHDDSLPPLVHAVLAHAQFEAIHPFLDGNGRVGRLLIALLLAERGTLPSPLLYLSAYFEATREEYYAHLLAVTETGAWESWLTYFLSGVRSQAEDALGRIEHIDTLFESWLNDLADVLSERLEEVLELFVESPFWTVGEVGKRLGVAYTTARRAVDRLEEAGIVSLFGNAKRNRVYCARAILAALEGPVEPAARTLSTQRAKPKCCRLWCGSDYARRRPWRSG